MAKIKYNDVDSFVAGAQKDAQPLMNELRKIIKTTVPKAEEVVAYGVPIYKLNGVVGGFSVAKSHVSFGVDSMTKEDRVALEAKGYKTGSKTIQIKFDQKVPAQMIKKLLKAQVKINTTKSKNQK